MDCTILGGSYKIEAVNVDLSSRTEEQSSSLAEAAASMESITATVRQNADNAQRSANLVEQYDVAASVFLEQADVLRQLMTFF